MPHAWHESVRLYEILDRASGRSIAHFYADLHPREGKFTHAAAYPLVVGHRAADGIYVTPVSAILANFTPPSASQPALLRHRELETLFHEFGHILHMSLTRAEYAALLRRRDRVGLRRGSVADHGALDLGAIGAAAVRPASRHR